jgi:pimeloyl-ACP methyl ester carboxylesterase
MNASSAPKFTAKTALNQTRTHLHAELVRAGKWFALGALLLVLALGAAVYWNPLWVVDQSVRLQFAIEGMHSEYVQVGSNRVHYYVGGHGAPLLLIHGMGGRAEDWAPAIAILTQNGFRIYAIDLLGSGRSAHPDMDYSIAEQTAMVRGFLSALHLRQVDVAGWSLGGWVALKLTQESPQSIRRLVLIDSAGLTFYVPYGPQIFTPADTAGLQRLMSLLTPHPVSMPNFLARAILRRLRPNYWVVQRTVQSAIVSRDRMDGRLGAIHVPVLLAWGAQDALIPPSIAETMHQQMPQSVLGLYQGCGHSAPIACAGRIMPDVTRFLNSNPPMTGGEYEK